MFVGFEHSGGGGTNFFYELKDKKLFFCYLYSSNLQATGFSC